MFERVRDSYEFPADIGGDDDPGALRWTATVIAVTAGLLALFNAQALTGWAEDLPPGPAAVKLVTAATAWEDATGSLGLPHARMHKAWKQVERAEWIPRRPEVPASEPLAVYAPRNLWPTPDTYRGRGT